jgi:hypothetical protein
MNQTGFKQADVNKPATFLSYCDAEKLVVDSI